jgi:hypothetical protein
VHQERLAGLQAAAPVQPEPRGLVGDGQGRGLRVVQGRRRGVHRLDGQRRVLRQHPDLRADDAVADPHPLTLGHALAERDDVAAQLDPRHERQLGPLLVLASGQQDVGEVDRDGPHADQHLAGPGLGHRYVVQLHDLLGLPVGDHAPRLHRRGYAHVSVLS